MKKLNSNQVLMARSTSSSIRVNFYEVIKATTRTCEIRELRKEILNQTQLEQEVMPLPGEFSGPPIRKRVESTGCVKIEDGVYAWPWDGSSHWQTAIIFIP